VKTKESATINKLLKKESNLVKYNEWLNVWLDNVVKPTSKSRTYERYKEIVDGHIKPKLGDYVLCELTPLILQQCVTELLQNGNLITGKGLSANTVNAVITVIQNSLKSAVVFGELKEYTAYGIKRPKAKDNEVSCFSLIEQRQIELEVRQSKKDKLFGIILCLYTGLRIGELLALTWSDIDTIKGTLSVTKSCHYGKGANGKFERCTELPKTVTSRRTIPIPKQMLGLLKTVKKRSESKYVIASGSDPISVRSYQRSFALMLKKLKIPHKGFHALRHTFATRALECGMDVKTLSEILGHKNASVTLNRYVHSLMEHKQEMMNKLGKLLQ